MRIGTVEMNKLSNWIRPRLRLWTIYSKLGFIPWRKPRPAKESSGGVFKGTGQTIIPFLNDDAKRTFSHILLRPGYMIRDYINGQHERYLAPFTALLVFYSVFTLLVAVVHPESTKKSFNDGFVEALDGSILDDELTAGITINGSSFQIDSTDTNSRVKRFTLSIVKTMAQSVALTHLDQYPDLADTSWKQSLAAVEGDLRSKGIPLFLQNFFLLWIAMVWLLRKKYDVSVSGAAAASAYVLCQFCIFMFLALILSLGQKTELGVIVMGILLFIDYRQWLGISSRRALGLTVKTGLIYLVLCIIFYILLTAIVIAIGLLRA